MIKFTYETKGYAGHISSTAPETITITMEEEGVTCNEVMETFAKFLVAITYSPVSVASSFIEIGEALEEEIVDSAKYLKEHKDEEPYESEDE